MMLLPLLGLTVAQDTLRLPTIFSDGMVLQRNMPIPVFGSGVPGTRVLVQLGADRKSTYVASDGRWLVKLNPLASGGGLTLTVNTSGSRKSFSNIVVGEVWVASGQSNMEWRLENALGGPEEARAPEPGVRMFTVARNAIERPQDDVNGAWQESSPQTAGRFSAVAYFFARDLHRKLKIPVGVIHTSWGGTPAQAWTSLPALSAAPSLKHYVDEYARALAEYPERKAAYDVAYAEWLKRAYKVDPENIGQREGWQNDETDTGWTVCTLPNTFQTTIGVEMLGSVWYHRAIDLPPGFSKVDCTLELGPVDDFDTTYVNGVQIGKTFLETPNAWLVPRKYRIPAGKLRPGRNWIAVRVFNQSGPAGFMGLPNEMKVTCDGGPSISIAGKWSARIEKKLDALPAEVMARQPATPFGPNHPNAASNLYNGMIAPLIPFGIKGVIWYQGESNADRAHEYRTLFPTLIQDWRSRWNQGDFPFYFVQLANYMARKSEPSESAWAELRDAQSSTLSLPNTGQAVIIDIGEEKDIHPRNKKDVGARLARIALAKNYGWSIEYSGPVAEKSQIGGTRIRLSFSHASGLKTSDDGPVVGFQIAGQDHVWHWATAVIEGTTVVVSSPEVPHPIAIRYAWSDNPKCNLVNGDGLPAGPFRTDDWPLTTEHRK